MKAVVCTLAAAVLVLVLIVTGRAQLKAPPSPGPDERYKADILVIVAHPDDETLISGYLARAILDQHKRVAVIYGTRGNSGGNVIGYEQAASLGAVREIEGRRALATLGIFNAWFLGGPDTPGQDVLRSLETWNHGASLDQTIRLVRLTRPEVILTWLPDYVVGENHGDHQAASVLANEAFDLAGDPTAFSEQVAAPRNRNAIANLTEGLQPWQPQKIYYFSDTSHPEFLKGQGPQYSITEVSPSRHVPYNQIIAEEASQHLTQYGVGLVAKEALAKGDFHIMEAPIQFVFGKSVVKSSKTGDLFEGVQGTPARFSPVPGYKPEAQTGVHLDLGGSWAFYKLFWRAHNLEHIANLVTPEASVGRDGLLNVPLVLVNDTDQESAITLQVVLPQGWTDKSGSATYTVPAHGFYPITSVVDAGQDKPKQWREVTWKGQSAGKEIGAVTLRVFTATGGLPQ